MRRLIYGFAGRTYHIVGNLMHWLFIETRTIKIRPQHKILVAAKAQTRLRSKSKLNIAMPSWQMESHAIKIRPPRKLLVILASASSKCWSDDQSWM